MTPPVITGLGDRNLRLTTISPISHRLVQEPRRSPSPLDLWCRPLSAMLPNASPRLLYSLKSNPTITQGGHEMFITDYFAG